MVDGDQPRNRRTVLAAVGVPWIGSIVAGTDRSKTNIGPQDASNESAESASMTETKTTTETASDDTSPPWTKYYGERTDDDDGYGIVATDDGLVVAGKKQTEEGGIDAWLFKLSERTGEVEWSRVYEGSEVGPWPNDRTVALTQTRDGGFALGGTRTVESGESRVLFMKTDADGRRTATEAYVESNAYGVDVLQPDVGGYALLGTDVLIRTDPDGTERWRTEFSVDGPTDISVSGMTPGHDGGYVVAGSSFIRSGRSNVFTAKVTDDGELAWSREHDVGSGDNANDIVRTETGYALVGRTATGTSCPEPNSQKIDGLVLHLTASGERDWFRTYGSDGFDEFSSVVLTDDGGLFVGGYGDSSTDEQNFWMVKTTATGELEWSRDGSLRESASVEDVAQTPSGRYVGMGVNRRRSSTDVIVANLGRPE